MKKVASVMLILICCIQNLIAQETNNSLHFESNNYVEMNAIAPDVSNLNEFTIEFWLKFNGQDNTDYNTFYAVNASDYSNRFIIRFAGPVDGIADAAVVYINDGSNQYIIGSTPIGDNECHHIAFTYNNGACALYVDGQLDASGNYTIAFQPTDLHSLGQEYDMSPDPASAFYTGELDDIRIWDVAKSQSEIDIYKDVELLGSETDLVTYFNCNQGIPSADNTALSNLDNLAQPAQSGTLVNFNLNGSTSNFIAGSCSNSSVSIDENEILPLVEISPNPTTGLLNIPNVENISSIIVRNLVGQIILDLEPNSIIDISGLPKATYLIEFSTNDSRTRIQRVSKL